MELEERFRELFTGLGIARAHVGGGYALDAVTLVRTLPEAIASMTLVCPARLPTEPLKGLEDRLLFISGDAGPGAESVPRVLEELPRARSFRLRNYADSAWADALADRRSEIEPAVLEFLTEISRRESLPAPRVESETGSIAGINYEIRGSGPPLILLPLSLARSQWDPLMGALSREYTTVRLGGAHLGMVPTLEARMRGGYQTVVRNVVEAAKPRQGERILEVGCGSGAVIRWLAQYTGGANSITGVDVNDYLLREASKLTDQAAHVTFERGDAEALPLPSDSFDVTLSFTVMEEVNADRMLAELVRVTRPGGRVGVVVRATDMQPWLNLDFPPALREAVAGVPGAGADADGCADRSLYRRFVGAGLEDLVMGPQYGPDTGRHSPERLRLFVGRVAQGLAADHSREFREYVRRAVADGSMVWAEPYHSAVGRKP